MPRGCLEEHLADLGARRPGGAAGESDSPIYAQPRLLEKPVPKEALEAADLPDLHFSASFRSPYTWVSTERAIRLANVLLQQDRLWLPQPPTATNAAETLECTGYLSS